MVIHVFMKQAKNLKEINNPKKNGGIGVCLEILKYDMYKWFPHYWPINKGNSESA